MSANLFHCHPPQPSEPNSVSLVMSVCQPRTCECQVEPSSPENPALNQDSCKVKPLIRCAWPVLWTPLLSWLRQTKSYICLYVWNPCLLKGSLYIWSRTSCSASCWGIFQVVVQLPLKTKHGMPLLFSENGWAQWLDGELVGSHLCELAHTVPQQR